MPLRPRHAAAPFIALTLVGSFALPPVAAVQISNAPAFTAIDKSDAEKQAEKAAKEAEKAAKDAAKEAEKAAKDAQKAAEEAAKQAEKAAEEAQKAADKAAKEATKDALKQAASSESAAARAEAAAAAVLLITQYSDQAIEREIRDAQRETRAQFLELKSESQGDYAAAKRAARSAFKEALEAAEDATSKVERKRLREVAREEYDQAKRRNRNSYLSALERARRYNGKAQLIFFDPGVTELGEYDDAVAVAAVATSGLPVEITSTTPETCAIADGFLSPSSPGVCTVAATQSGSDVYAPARVEVNIQILDQPDPQSITFTAIPSLQVGAPSQVLVASASSGLPVLFSSLTPNTCSTAGAVVTALASGTCTVEAVQSGNDFWQPAIPVQQSTTVSPAPTTEPAAVA